MGGKPDAETGACGVFADAVQSAANLLGTNTFLTAGTRRASLGNREEGASDIRAG